MDGNVCDAPNYHIFFSGMLCLFVSGTRHNGGGTRGQTAQATATANTTSRRDDRVVSFAELNSRKVDPALVRASVLHYLHTPRTLTSYQFVNLGMASCRHCDVHVVTEVCETVRLLTCKRYIIQGRVGGCNG